MRPLGAGGQRRGDRRPLQEPGHSTPGLLAGSLLAMLAAGAAAKAAAPARAARELFGSPRQPDTLAPAARGALALSGVEEPAFRHASTSALSRGQRAVHLALALAWTAVTSTFWVWWLGHASASASWLYWTQSVTLLYQTTVLPWFYWLYVRKMRRPIEVQARPGMRVALITLCVPSSESITVIRRQLEALRQVSYPHDSWVLDEGGSAEVRALAERCGVNYFSRHGIARWHVPACDTVHHCVDQSARRGRHHRHPTGHRLQRHDAERLVPGRAHHGVGRAQQRGDVGAGHRADGLHLEGLGRCGTAQPLRVPSQSAYGPASGSRSDRAPLGP